MQKIPTTIITGFLGAGKTTLIRNVLEQANGKRIALIVNEFGDAGVDGAILEGCGNEACQPGDIIELANGCICCTVADDFVPAMTQLIERDDAPDHIIIETSGLALPQPLVKAFNWPEVSGRVTVDGVIAVVDGPALASGRFAHDPRALEAQRAADEELDHESPLHELFEDQLRCADLVVLNKTDLLSASGLIALKDTLHADMRPGAGIIACAHGNADANALLGFHAMAESDGHSRASHHELAGEDDHDHDDFDSFAVHLGECAGRESVLARIAAVVNDPAVLRLKGFVAIAGNDARLLVQAVGPRIDSHFDRPWAPGEQRETTLVVIGLAGMDKDAISTVLAG